jgi:phosphoribosylamine--glycine ligase
MESDLMDVLWAVATRRLHEVDVVWSNLASVAVVLASGGYPGSYKTGFAIDGLDTLDDGVLAFHAGTALDGDGRLVTGGGRVLTITAMGSTIQEARSIAYRNAERITFEGIHYRRDIGANLIDDG